MLGAGVGVPELAHLQSCMKSHVQIVCDRCLCGHHIVAPTMEGGIFRSRNQGLQLIDELGVLVSANTF